MPAPPPPPPPPPPRTPPSPQPPPAPRPRNARATRKAPHGVLEVDWPFFGEMCRALALKIFRDYDPDVVIGIARAGVIPGAVVASILQRDRSEEHTSELQSRLHLVCRLLLEKKKTRISKSKPSLL